MAEHIANAKSRPHTQKICHMIHALGADKFKIALLEECPGASTQELRAAEGRWVRLLGTINSLIPGRTRLEWRAEHREINRVAKRAYYYRNRDRILEHANAASDCPCGGRFTRSNKAAHARSQIHQEFLAKSAGWLNELD